MNVLMIHGIGQEGSTQQELIDKWTNCLHGVAPSLLKGSNVNMPYYGTTLANWTTGKTKAAVSMGTDNTVVDIGDDKEMKFLASALEEAFVVSGGGEAEIEAAIEEAGENTVPMDTFLGRRVAGLARALEKMSPAKGSILLRVVKQAHTYLSAPGAGTAVDSIVRPYLQESPQVLITHSLGTVIAFKLLREMEAGGKSVEIPLLITMGSPLGLDALKKKLGPPRYKPSFVKRWANFYDPSDLVALGKALDKDTFAAGIENDGGVNNQTSNAHGIVGYLPHEGVISALKKVLQPA
jgi:hypothetical protein